MKKKKSICLSVIGFVVLSVSTLSFAEHEIFGAIKDGSLERVKEILSRGKIDANCVNGKRETPLHVACRLKYFDIVKLLVEEEKKGGHGDGNERTSLLSINQLYKALTRPSV